MKILNFSKFIFSSILVLGLLNQACDKKKVDATPSGDSNNSQNTPYSWNADSFGMCNAMICGTTGVQTRNVYCTDSTSAKVADSMCASLAQPPQTQTCTAPACQQPPYTYFWQPGAYGACSAT